MDSYNSKTIRYSVRGVGVLLPKTFLDIFGDDASTKDFNLGPDINTNKYALVNNIRLECPILDNYLYDKDQAFIDQFLDEVLTNFPDYYMMNILKNDFDWVYSIALKFNCSCLLAYLKYRGYDFSSQMAQGILEEQNRA